MKKILGRNHSDIIMSGVGLPNYTTLKDWYDQTQSAGTLQKVLITDDGTHDGINIAPFDCLLRTNTTYADGELKFVSFNDITHLTTFTIGVTYWIYADYNNGSPTISSTTTYQNINYTTQIVLGRILRSATDTLRIVEAGATTYDMQAKATLRIHDLRFVERATGLVVGHTGTRNVTVTAGSLYAVYTKLTIDAINTATGDTFISYYRDGVGGYTRTTGNTQISNTLYDNGTGTLDTLNNNEYGVHWMYMTFDGDLVSVYGRGSYTLAQAQAVQPPSDPVPFVNEFGIFCAKIIILKNATSFSVQSAFDYTFTAVSPSAHNELSGLQGGTAGEYYHLTSAQLAALVYTSRTINGYALSSDITLTKSDIGLSNVTNDAQVKKIASSTDNAVMRWHTTTGDTPQDSLVTIDDSGSVNIPSGQYYKINGTALSKSDIGLADVANLKVKLDATTAPGTTNDTSEGYSVGSRWIDITADKEYVCLDNTEDAAVWTETTQSGGSAGGAGGQLVFDGGYYTQWGNLGERKYVVGDYDIDYIILSWETLPTISSGDSWGDGSTANTGKLVVSLYARDRYTETSTGTWTELTTIDYDSSYNASRYTRRVSVGGILAMGPHMEYYVDVKSVTNSATITLGLGLQVTLEYS